MRDDRPFVVVSGLAAAGKTTVAIPLAEALGLPLVSKDAIKEALFDVVGIGDWQWSKTLSRAADAAMVQIASALDAAVLDNYWYAETVQELLAPIDAPLVEVWCRIDPALAWSRSQARARHPGHADGEPEPEQARRAVFARRFPLGVLGPVIEVDTSSPVDIAALAAAVIAAGR
jgi:predicted kinase